MAKLLWQSSIHNNNVVKDRDMEIKCKVKPSIMGFNEIRPMFEVSSGIMAIMEKKWMVFTKKQKGLLKSKRKYTLDNMPSNYTFLKNLKIVFTRMKFSSFFSIQNVYLSRGKENWQDPNKNMYYFYFLDTRQVRSWYLLGFLVFISYGIKK